MYVGDGATADHMFESVKCSHPSSQTAPLVQVGVTTMHPASGHLHPQRTQKTQRRHRQERYFVLQTTSGSEKVWESKPQVAMQQQADPTATRGYAVTRGPYNNKGPCSTKHGSGHVTQSMSQVITAHSRFNFTHPCHATTEQSSHPHHHSTPCKPAKKVGLGW